METGKSEISALPEGMSSEELDALTTGEEVEDDKLAQEALDATEDKSSPAEESVDETKDELAEVKPADEKPVEETKVVEEEVDPKDAVIGDFRRKLRDSELESARLQGELEARKSIQTKPEDVAKSPLEIAEAAYMEENGTLDGFAMNGDLYRRQRAFDDELVAKTTAAATQEQGKTAGYREANALQAGEFSPEKMGEGLDYTSVVNLGQRYLDDADYHKLRLVSERDGIAVAAKKAYELCKDAILAANNTDSKLLQNAIDVNAKKSQTKPKKESTDIDALITEGEEEKGETESEAPSDRLYDFITN